MLSHTSVMNAVSDIISVTNGLSHSRSVTDPFSETSVTSAVSDTNVMYFLTLV